MDFISGGRRNVNLLSSRVSKDCWPLDGFRQLESGRIKLNPPKAGATRIVCVRRPTLADDNCGQILHCANSMPCTLFLHSPLLQPSSSAVVHLLLRTTSNQTQSFVADFWLTDISWDATNYSRGSRREPPPVGQQGRKFAGFHRSKSIGSAANHPLEINLKGPWPILILRGPGLYIVN